MRGPTPTISATSMYRCAVFGLGSAEPPRLSAGRSDLRAKSVRVPDRLVAASASRFHASEPE